MRSEVKKGRKKRRAVYESDVVAKSSVRVEKRCRSCEATQLK